MAVFFERKDAPGEGERERDLLGDRSKESSDEVAKGERKEKEKKMENLQTAFFLQTKNQNAPLSLSRYYYYWPESRKKKKMYLVLERVSGKHGGGKRKLCRGRESARQK